MLSNQFNAYIEELRNAFQKITSNPKDLTPDQWDKLAVLLEDFSSEFVHASHGSVIIEGNMEGSSITINYSQLMRSVRLHRELARRVTDLKELHHNLQQIAIVHDQFRKAFDIDYLQRLLLQVRRGRKEIHAEWNRINIKVHDDWERINEQVTDLIGFLEQKAYFRNSDVIGFTNRLGKLRDDMNDTVKVFIQSQPRAKLSCFDQLSSSNTQFSDRVFRFLDLADRLLRDQAVTLVALSQ